MKVSFVNELGNDIHVFETDDLSGIIAAVKESSAMIFNHDPFYEYDEMRINHYEEDGKIVQELIVYFKDFRDESD
ncbi:hypothetical protein F9U64_19060 [Gracilibacillus oryzae]|uniref:Uncharacterized protein n=1 Tax=Gracilibacillus oryzae TaxID=1672701 RepID=A0A7C8KQA1_9BACI|nr:hypothetical protein [Gracilibacillus oryzae]KAB8126921.1 hypothetical protein F9U64_19060 [Gracilibacillus oryzae]